MKVNLVSITPQKYHLVCNTPRQINKTFWVREWVKRLFHPHAHLSSFSFCSLNFILGYPSFFPASGHKEFNGSILPNMKCTQGGAKAAKGWWRWRWRCGSWWPRRGHLAREVRFLGRSSVGGGGDAPAPPPASYRRSQRRATGTQVLLTWVSQSKSRLL